jgi:hypothetical protein
VLARHRDYDRAAEPTEQDAGALAPVLALVEPKLSFERAANEPHRIAVPWLRCRRQTDEPATSRARISSITRSGSRAGRSPSMMRRAIPGVLLIAYHRVSTWMKI